MASADKITILSETRYDHRVAGSLPASCPTLDLSVTWDETAQNLLICRPPNQVVSRIQQHGRGGGGRATPRAVAWKPDGQFIAVGWSDGFVRLMSLENSKAAHHIQVHAHSTAAKSSQAHITHIAWVRNRVGSPFSPSSTSSLSSQPHAHSRGRQDQQNHQETWREILRSADGLNLGMAGLSIDGDGAEDDVGDGGGGGAGGEGGGGGGGGGHWKMGNEPVDQRDHSLSSEGGLDLPTELAFLEVDASLPKISPLPSTSAGTGDDALVFTSRTGVEFLFQPLKREDTVQVHVMLVGTRDGSLQLSIYDSFVIGCFPSAAVASDVLSHHSTPATTSLRLIHHASHPDVSTHALFLRPFSSLSSVSDNADNTDNAHNTDNARNTHNAHNTHNTHNAVDNAPGEEEARPSEILLAPMDLPFVVSSPINLALLASKLTTLQKLLRYLHQTHLHMQLEYKNTRELPGRFLKAVQEDLASAETGPRDIVQAFYHTAVTGHTHDAVRVWLSDSVAERSHKRWDKAVTSGLTNLRALAHENLLPSLDRIAAILSRLRGLALFHATSRDDIGFTAPQVSRAADVASALALVGHRILLLAMEELDLFTAFSTWMRQLIDNLASQSPDDPNTDKDVGVETGKVLVYIQRYLVPTTTTTAAAAAATTSTTTAATTTTTTPTRFRPRPTSLKGGRMSLAASTDQQSQTPPPNATTPLGLFLDDPPAVSPSLDDLLAQQEQQQHHLRPSSPSTSTISGDAPLLMDVLDRQLQRYEEGLPYQQALPNLGFLASALTQRAHVIFSDIAEAQKRSVRFGQATRLAIGDGGVSVSAMDATMRADRREHGTGSIVFTALASRERENELWLFRTDMRIINGISSGVTTQACPLALPPGGRFHHFKFLNTRTLLALFTANPDSPVRLLRIPTHYSHLPFGLYESSSPPTTRTYVFGVDIFTQPGEMEKLTFALPAELSRLAGSEGKTATEGTGPAPVPSRMEAHDVSYARGRIPARVCLLSAQRDRWTTLALPDVRGD